MATEEQIREMAYAIWEQEGRPEGKDLEHYLRAKQILEVKEAARIIELAPQKPPVELAPPPQRNAKKSTRRKKR